MTLFGRNAALTTQGPTDLADAPDGDAFGSIEPQSAAALASEPAVSLEAVLTADISIAWDESVSIVEALCEAVQGNVQRVIPGAKEIFLTGTGTVAVRSAAGTPEPVEAGRRLLELLGKGAVPAPLRLFASQAVRAEQHPSLADFQQGLNYFAKPGGRARIIAVFERSSRELAAMPFPSEGETKPGKALDRARSAEKSSRRWQISRDAVLATGAIAVTVVVVWAAYFAWLELSKPGAGPAPVVEAKVEPAPPAAPPAARGGAPARPATSATSAAPAALRPGPAAPAAGAATVSTGLAPAAGPVDLAIAGALPSPAAPAVADAAGSGSDPASTAPVAVTAPLFVQETPAEPLDLDRVYTASDDGVVPATLVKQQLLPPAMGMPTGFAPLQLELLVSADGAVERARFLVPPRRMADMMLLSSAKMWTFNPALKDGRPVRSRVVMSWFVAP